MSTKLSERICNCIRELATNRAITDTVWLGTRGITVCEELAMIASELGGTAEEIETAMGENYEPDAREHCYDDIDDLGEVTEWG